MRPYSMVKLRLPPEKTSIYSTSTITHFVVIFMGALARIYVQKVADLLQAYGSKAGNLPYKSGMRPSK